jgi:hypothetical protein
MITKKNRPMRAIFFRDHEISELGPAGASTADSAAAVPVVLVSW